MDLHTLTTSRACAGNEWGKLSWYHPAHPGRHQPEPVWLDWLTDRGSLTRRLKQASEGRFRVQLLQQQLLRPALNESRLLGMGCQEYAIVRQVILHGAGQPWVFARTVMPLTSLQRANRHLLQLGNRSLGSVLFKQADTRRQPMQISAGTPDFIAPFVWGRRSVFQLRQAPILVTELFLPDFAHGLKLP